MEIMYDYGISQIDRVIEQYEKKYYLMPWLHKGLRGTLFGLTRFPRDLQWSWSYVKDEAFEPYVNLLRRILEAWGIEVQKEED